MVYTNYRLLLCRAEHVDVVEVARQKAAIPPAMRRTSSLWNRFLLDDELIKMGGLKQAQGAVLEETSVDSDIEASFDLH